MTKRIPLFEKNSSAILAWATVDDEEYQRFIVLQMVHDRRWPSGARNIERLHTDG